MQLRNQTGQATKAGLRRCLALSAAVAVLNLLSFEASCQEDIQNLKRTGNQWAPVDPSGTWCGAKALWLIAHAEGFSYTLEDIKSMLGGNDSSDGTVSLASLCAALDELGFASVAVQCRLELLRQHEGIALTVHNMFSEGEKRTTLHCMVFLGYEDGYYSVVDPFHPSRIQVLSESDFRNSWTTHAVLVARQGAELPHLRSWTRFLIACLFVQILVAFGFLLRRHGLFRMLGCAAVVPLSLIGCHGSSDSGEMLGSEVLEFEYYAHDAGPVLLTRHGGSQAILTHAFTFVNRGDRPIQVIKGKTNCSCFVLRYPDAPVQPGEEGSIYVQADVSGLAGPVTVNALLSVATPAQEWVKLQLRCFVVRPPFTRRGRLDFGVVEADGSERRAIELMVPLMPGEDMPSVTATTAAGLFQCSCEAVARNELKEIGAVGQYRIECSIAAEVDGADLRDTLVLAVEGRSEILSIPLRARSGALK